MKGAYLYGSYARGEADAESDSERAGRSTRGMKPETGQLLEEAVRAIQGDYDVVSEVDAEAVTAMLRQAREFLAAAQRYLTGPRGAA